MGNFAARWEIGGKLEMIYLNVGNRWKISKSWLLKICDIMTLGTEK